MIRRHLLGIAGLALVLVSDARAQVQCRPVPNAYAFTMVCSNGYWWSVLEDGTVVDGNGAFDRNADMQGSTFEISPLTSKPTGRVTAPTQQAPTPYGARQP